MNSQTMFRWKLATAVILAAALTGGLSAQRVSQNRAKQRLLMREKLAYTQRVLEGLTLENFRLVSENALKMRDLTHRDEWFISTSAIYKQATTNFQKNVDAVYMAAVDKQLKVGTEAFKRVIDSCVSCHESFRVEQMPGATKPNP